MQLFVEASNGAFQNTQELNTAMDEGRLKGQVVIDILTNLGLVLRQKFGASATEAAQAADAAFARFQNSVTPNLAKASFTPVGSSADWSRAPRPRVNMPYPSQILYAMLSYSQLLSPMHTRC
jgi:hypothetical protein